MHQYSNCLVKLLLNFFVMALQNMHYQIVDILVNGKTEILKKILIYRITNWTVSVYISIHSKVSKSCTSLDKDLVRKLKFPQSRPEINSQLQVG